MKSWVRHCLSLSLAALEYELLLEKNVLTATLSGGDEVGLCFVERSRLYAVFDWC